MNVAHRWSMGEGGDLQIRGNCCVFEFNVAAAIFRVLVTLILLKLLLAVCLSDG